MPRSPLVACRSRGPCGTVGGGDFYGDNCRSRLVRAEVRLVVVVEITERPWLVASWTSCARWAWGKDSGRTRR